MRIHATLPALIAHARPRLLRLSEDECERHPVISSIGPVLMIRLMLAIALGSLLLMLVTSHSDQLSEANLRKTLLQDRGCSSYWNQLALGIPIMALPGGFPVHWFIASWLA